MRQYETVFLISPSLEEEETTKIITQISGIISKEKGKLIQEDRWGKRKLAYPIKKFEEAFYVFFHYEGDSNIPFELERRFKQTEAILRFLTVKKETRENVRKKRKGIPAKEETAMPAVEAEIVTPQEEKVEKKEEEETAVPAKDEEIVIPQDEEKAEKKEEEAEKKEEEETATPAAEAEIITPQEEKVELKKEEEIAIPQDEEKTEKKEEEAEKKEEEETAVPAKDEEIAVSQDEEEAEKKEEEAEKKGGDKEDLNSTETIKEDK
jgi:small subunit ribosomal protein S6